VLNLRLMQVMGKLNFPGI